MTEDQVARVEQAATLVEQMHIAFNLNDVTRFNTWHREAGDVLQTLVDEWNQSGGSEEE